MRKSIIIIILITIVLASCKNNEKKVETNSPQEVAQEQVVGILSEQWMKEIQLNNGAKWEANLGTTEGAGKMYELLRTQTTSTLEDYHKLATKLNYVKTKIIEECTMTGASHDNLHIWLYPLIEKIDALSKTDKLDEASELRQNIKEHIDAYSTYFQKQLN